MFYDTESHLPLPDDKEFIIETSHFRSNSNTEQTVISQKRNLNEIDAKCDSIILTSIDKYENDHLSALNTSCSAGKAETEEADEYENDKIISIIGEDKRNNSKEEKLYKCCGNTGLFEKVFIPIKGSSKDLKRRRKKRAFSLLDILISTSIVAPLSIGFWRGVWSSMDYRAELFPSWFCFTFGAALHAAYTIFKDRFHDVYMKKWAKLNWRKRLPYRVLRILYTYTFGVACIAHWRGSWIIIDNHLFVHTW
ncbi:hypothetical protein ALC56_01065 [Trachymyrmex septentrionalis]|uniref:Uncharacterized protein n=1 Tax=Trachymyrmex septentrionalis TaxID=34720 RepID=A0A195FWD0_9HYME|nr:PREDICTED: uncharacterized protein LOC108751449 [Trachymyrmex septentrionalis]KYN44622.1 hypothetical protein ALC56_01065 [Trachymyrmex septentrionalis]